MKYISYCKRTCNIFTTGFLLRTTGGSRANIGYRVVQQQPMMGLNNDHDDKNLEAADSSDDERAGYPTLPADGGIIGSRPSVNSLRHVSIRVGIVKNYYYYMCPVLY